MSQAVQHPNGNLITREFLPEPAGPLSINPECCGVDIPMLNKFHSITIAFDHILLQYQFSYNLSN